MKICAYCTTKNRDEAIFCARCKRALRGSPIPKDSSALWFLVLLVFIGLGSYLFLSGAFLAPPSAQANSPTIASAPTRAPEAVTLYTCVENETRIRRTPGTQSETTGGLRAGTCLTVLGRTQDASWVYAVSDDHQTGWVAASTLPAMGKVDKVSIRDDSVLASSARPTLTSAEVAHGAQVFLTNVAATNLPGAPHSAYAASCFASADRIGDHITCKMEKAYCDYLPDVEGNPTVCSDRPYPDQTFTLTIFGDNWSEYDGQCLIVSGYLEINSGMLHIQASGRSQVSSCQ